MIKKSVKKSVKEEVVVKDSLENMFYIVKGQYCRGKDENDLSCYDPEKDTTSEWYRVLDQKTFYCCYCGSSLEKALSCVRKMVLRYHNSAKEYFKHVSSVTNEDYYQVHYLGHQPLNHEQLQRRQEGRCPRVSVAQKVLEKKVLSSYGDYYDDQIQEVIAEVVEDMKGNRLFKKSKKLAKKTLMKDTTKKVMDTPKEEKVIEHKVLDRKKNITRRKPVLKKR